MRRSRAQFKPNIGPALTVLSSASEEQKQVPKSDEHPKVTDTVGSVTSVAAVVPSTSNHPNETIMNVVPQPVHSPPIRVETSTMDNNDHVFRSPLPKRTDLGGHVLSPRTRLLSTSSAHDGGSLISPRNRLLSTCSEMFVHQKKERRKFTGDEQLDPKTMKMSDLITWNPRNEKKLDRTKLDNCETRSEMEREEERPAAPQLKLDANGKLVVDETSLLIDERATTSVWQIVQEDRTIRKVNSTSFRRWRKGTPWSEKETEFFYEILRSTGPDFGLMHDFFPRRSRNELKSKFNREEKLNWERLNAVMSKPISLEETLYERAETITRELNKEESEKIEAKTAKKKKNGEKSSTMEEDEWNEETADLEKEATHVIIELIELDKRKEEIGRIKRGERRKNDEKRKLSKEASTIIDNTANIITKRKKKEKENDELKKKDIDKMKERNEIGKKDIKDKTSDIVTAVSDVKNSIAGYPKSDESGEEI